MPPAKSYWQREQEARRARAQQAPRRAKREAGQELTEKFSSVNQGQQDVWRSSATVTAAISGHGGGKSQIGAYWMIREAGRYKGDTFLVAGPTYNTLEKSSIPKLRGLLRLHGLPWEFDQTRRIGFRVSQREYWLPQGGVIYFVSCDKPGSMQGTHARAFWMDETVDTDYYAFETLLGRIALNNGKGIITSTPYDMGWLYGNVYQPWVAAGRPGWKEAKEIFVAQWKSIDNPHFSKERFEWFKNNWPAWRFRLLYEGEFERPMGLVYDCITADTWIDDFEIPDTWPRKLGIDFGIHDPTACVWMAQAPTGQWIVYDEYYVSGWMRFADEEIEGKREGKHSTQMEMLEEIVARCQRRGEEPEAVYCDDSEPDYIMQARDLFEDRLGVSNVLPAHKKEILPGIQRVYAQFRGGMKIFKSLKNFRNEAESYSWKIDQTTGELEKDAKPKDNNNHLMDALRYGIVGSPEEQFNSFGVGKISLFDNFRLPGSLN